MWRNFGDILGNFGEILGNFEKFWEILPQFTRFQKLSPKVHLWEKNTNMRSDVNGTRDPPPLHGKIHLKFPF